ncbi:MAG: ubiquinol-cytochrome c reductase iron-sulfur subunit [Terriglobia bacterium]
MSTESKQEEKNPKTHYSAPDVATSPQMLGRRRFLGWLIGIGSCVVGILLLIPLFRLALYPLFGKAGQAVWSDLGPVDQYDSLTAPVHRVVKIQHVDGWRQTVSSKVVYVTKTPGGKLKVLTAICPHLGCEVAWLPQLHEFKCPCHGGTFAPDGKYITGPPPRGMDALPIAVRNGRLMVRYEYFRNLVPEREVIG